MKTSLRIIPLLLSFAFAGACFAESCSTSTEMDAATRSALQNAALQDFGFIASANVAQVAANSITDIASNTEGLTGLLNEHKDKLAGSTAQVRNVYLFDASGSAP